MISLSPELKKVILDAVREYLAAVPEAGGPSLVKIESALDQQRAKLIDEKIKPLLTGYFDGSVPLPIFKRQIDGINKQNQLWGFKGIKGQMFFNMLVNNAKSENESDSELKSALLVPANDEVAARQLRKFHEYVVRVGDQLIAAGGDRNSRPKPSGVPFFVSYFWQIQNRNIWPVYYTNSVQVITAMNLWQETGEVDQDYLSYKRLHEGLIELIVKEQGQAFTLYDVEHVFWFKGGRLLVPPPQIRRRVRQKRQLALSNPKPKLGPQVIEVSR